MSGGLAQLVAIGAQDAHLVGQPEISFFRSTYKRHTNFSQTVERQVIQGNVSNNGMSTVRFERKGDLLNYVYLVVNNGNQTENVSDWTQLITKVELLIGGQVIDEQDSTYSYYIAPTLSAANYSKSRAAGIFNNDSANRFYPLRFFFCENWQSAIPLIALQYHDVELRITWGPQASDSNRKWDVYAHYAYLDTMERDYFASKSQNILITQVQRATASTTRIQELNFNHPVKYLASGVGTGIVNINGNDGTTDNKVKIQINGVDVADYKFANPNFSAVTLYYHTSHSDSTVASSGRIFLYPFCLDTSKLQPTGTLNFSRLDSARIMSDLNTFNQDIYAVNYNILKVENGMGGLMYSN